MTAPSELIPDAALSQHVAALRERIGKLEDDKSALIAANKELGEQAAYARREALVCKNREYDLVQKLARTERRMAGVRP